MNINYEYDAISASDRLESVASKKINKLVSRYDQIVAADVYFKSRNSASGQNAMVCGVRLNVPQTSIFAESEAATFDQAITETANDLERQLRKYKEKLKHY